MKNTKIVCELDNLDMDGEVLMCLAKGERIP